MLKRKRDFLAIYGGGLLLTLILRWILKAVYIDPDTGFYEGAGILPVFFIALLLALAVLSLIRSGRGAGFHLPSNESCRIIGIFEAVIGLFCGINFIVSFSQTMEILVTPNSSTRTIMGTVVLTFLFGLCLLSFLLLAKNHLSSPAKPVFTAIPLIPIITFLVWLITKFNAYALVVNISDRLLHILFLLSTLMFLLGYGRILIRYDVQKGLRYAVGFGLTSALTGLNLSIPSFFYKNNAPVFSALGNYTQAENLLILSLSLLQLIFAVICLQTATAE